MHHEDRGRKILSPNTIQTVIEQVRAEFLKVPDLRLSVEQMEHLSGADRKTVEMVLEFLADTKFLSRTSTYARLTPIDPSCTPATDTEIAQRMIGVMPTRAGDIVISHVEASASFYLLWKVIDDRQQEARPEQYASTALGRTAALALARMMARGNRGAVFLRDAATSAWTKLASQPQRRFIAATGESTFELST